MVCNVLIIVDGCEKIVFLCIYVVEWFVVCECGEKFEIGWVDFFLCFVCFEQFELFDLCDVLKCKLGFFVGWIVFLYVVVYIELNVVDLYWDVIVCFSEMLLLIGFFDDWVWVVDDEFKYFNFVCDCFEVMDSFYGVLFVYVGMWWVVEDIVDDIMGCFVVVFMVFEVWGFDVMFGMIDIFCNVGDKDIVEVLNVIYVDEVYYVVYGLKWFYFFCG